MAFENLSVRRKLLLITMIASGMALLLACLALILFDQAKAHEALQRELRIEDLSWLKRLQETEDGPMRRVIVAYLHEFF